MDNPAVRLRAARIVVATLLAGASGALAARAAEAPVRTPFAPPSIRAALAQPSRARPPWMIVKHQGDASTGATLVAWFRPQGGPNGTYYFNVYGLPNEANRGPVCQLNMGGQGAISGIRTDAAGNFLVPVPVAYGAIVGSLQVFSPACQHLTTGFDIPFTAGQVTDVAVDAKGHTYIADGYSGYSAISLPANIQQFTGGYGPNSEFGRLTGMLDDLNITNILGLAVDGHGNVWVSYTAGASGPGSIAAFRGGENPATFYNNISLGYPGGMLFDRSHNLLVVDTAPPSGVPAEVDVYAPPYTGSAPTLRLPLHGNGAYCALTHDQKRMDCADGQYGSVDWYAYPSGTYLFSYTNGLSTSFGLSGIANSPA